MRSVPTEYTVRLPSRIELQSPFLKHGALYRIRFFRRDFETFTTGFFKAEFGVVKFFDSSSSTTTTTSSPTSKVCPPPDRNSNLYLNPPCLLHFKPAAASTSSKKKQQQQDGEEQSQQQREQEPFSPKILSFTVFEQQSHFSPVQKIASGIEMDLSFTLFAAQRQKQLQREQFAYERMKRMEQEEKERKSRNSNNNDRRQQQEDDDDSLSSYLDDTSVIFLPFLKTDFRIPLSSSSSSSSNNNNNSNDNNNDDVGATLIMSGIRFDVGNVVKLPSDELYKALNVSTAAGSLDFQHEVEQEEEGEQDERQQQESEQRRKRGGQKEQEQQKEENLTVAASVVPSPQKLQQQQQQTTSQGTFSSSSSSSPPPPPPPGAENDSRLALLFELLAKLKQERADEAALMNQIISLTDTKRSLVVKNLLNPSSPKTKTSSLSSSSSSSSSSSQQQHSLVTSGRKRVEASSAMLLRTVVIDRVSLLFRSAFETALQKLERRHRQLVHQAESEGLKKKNNKTKKTERNKKESSRYEEEGEEDEGEGDEGNEGERKKKKKEEELEFVIFSDNEQEDDDEEDEEDCLASRISQKESEHYSSLCDKLEKELETFKSNLSEKTKWVKAIQAVSHSKISNLATSAM